MGGSYARTTYCLITVHAHFVSSYWNVRIGGSSISYFRIHLHSYWSAADWSGELSAGCIYSVHMDTLRAHCVVSFRFSSCDTHPDFILMETSTAGSVSASCQEAKQANTNLSLSPSFLSLSLSIWIRCDGCNHGGRRRGVEEMWKDESVSPPPSVGVWMGLPTPLCRGFPPSPAACVLITHARLQHHMQRSCIVLSLNEKMDIAIFQWLVLSDQQTKTKNNTVNSNIKLRKCHI